MTADNDPAFSEATIELTSVPAYGAFLNLKGVVRDIDPDLGRIVVYIRVHGGWWTKPYWDRPATEIAPDGTFSVNITTGGSDEQATAIAVFLVPSEYYPPGLRGEGELSPELFQKALAHASVTRSP